jgi:hypothetical protein
MWKPSVWSLPSPAAVAGAVVPGHSLARELGVRCATKAIPNRLMLTWLRLVVCSGAV